MLEGKEDPARFSFSLTTVGQVREVAWGLLLLLREPMRLLELVKVNRGLPLIKSSHSKNEHFQMNYYNIIPISGHTHKLWRLRDRVAALRRLRGRERRRRRRGSLRSRGQLLPHAGNDTK